MADRTESRHGTTYRNGVLTVICALLAVLAMRETGSVSASEAVAASGPPKVPNAFAQRLQIVDELKELKTITAKLTSMEKTMDTRLSSIEGQLKEQTAAMKAEQRRRGNEGNNE